MIRQIHDRDCAVTVASEEGRTDVVAVCNERGCGGNGGHFGQASELGLHVRLVELASVGEIGGCVCGIVVYDDYINISGGLEEGKKGVILVGFAAVDEGKVFLPGNERGVGVVVEGIGVDGVFVHEC